MKICSTLGTPPTDWQEGYQLASMRRIDFPKVAATPLSTIIPGASEDCIDLIYKMLQFDHNKRPTANQCLAHPWFSACKGEYQRRCENWQAEQQQTSQAKPPATQGFLALRNSQNQKKLNGMNSNSTSPMNGSPPHNSFQQSAQGMEKPAQNNAANKNR